MNCLQLSAKREMVVTVFCVSANVSFGFIFRNPYQKELCWSAEKCVSRLYNALSQGWKTFSKITGVTLKT